MAEESSAGNSGSPNNEAHHHQASLNNGKSTQAHPRRASISSHPIGKNSTEKSDSAKNTIPHYLRASTGSCHDFCKYGRKHEFEEKPWKKPLRKATAKSSPSDQSFVDIFVLGEKKKEKIVRQLSLADINDNSPDIKPSPDGKSHLPKSKTSGNNAYLPNKFPSIDPPEIIKREIRTSKELLVKGSLADNKPPKSERTMNHHSSIKSKPVRAAKPSSSSGHSNDTDFKTSQNMTAPKVFAKKVREPSAPILSPKLSLSKTASKNAKKGGNVLQKQRWISRDETKTPETENVSVKTLYVIETETENKSSTLLSEEFVSDNESVENDNVQPLKANVQPVKENRKIPRKSKVVVHEDKPRALLKLKFRSGKVLDLHSESSTPRKLIFRKPRTLRAEEGNGNSRKNLKRADGNACIPELSFEKTKIPPGKTLAKTFSNEKYRSPLKLKFRSGMVVDLHSDNNTPRRLRFRKVRVLGAEDEKGDDLTRRIFKKAEGNEEETGTRISSGKVALKHQDLEAKKDAQGLFNNVIEETANKLVESRKSKVKALVGAFETVISLQESRPSLHN